MKVAIFGGSGRMGCALVRACPAFGDIELAAVAECPGNKFIGMDSGTLAGLAPNGVALTDDAAAAAAAADVIIDFTFHTAVPETARLAAEFCYGYVLGTTGLTPEELAAVNAAAKKIPVLTSPNMSLGVNLLLSLVRKAASVLGPGYDAEIVEFHHRHKKDAPSGTALALAGALAEGRNTNCHDVACYGRHGVSENERDHSEIAVHALRGGDVVGDHTVIFASDGERVELVHKASSRECFANGALRGALWLEGRAPGKYTMSDVLGL